jgi:hypothetical protein
MTTATRQALEDVSKILHEAGWDAALPGLPSHLPDQVMMPIRAAYESLLHEDDLALLRQTLGAGQPVEDVGRTLGLSPDQARSRFVEAVRRLCAFAEVAEAQGFTPATPTTAG